MSFRDARSAQADTRTRESARHTRPACGRLAGDGNRQEQAVRLVLYPQASRRVRALPQPEPQQTTRLCSAVVVPLSFPPDDQPAPVRPDCVACQRRPAVRDGLCGRCLDRVATLRHNAARLELQIAQIAHQVPDHNNGPVTASTVPAHDPSGEADEHHAE